MTGKVGFMQGRLSPIINGMIQSFPWENWKNEIETAAEIGFDLMEWTIDQKKLCENPLMTRVGQREIQKLITKYSFKIPSLTGDCFMQSPFWKLDGSIKEIKENEFILVAQACSDIGIKKIVVPLVDNGSIENKTQEQNLVKFMENKRSEIERLGVIIVFESDYNPKNLKAFIEQFDKKIVGINYDIGNSAALGFDPQCEMITYGDRILNVHVKDRIFGGTTVPLGSGSVNFEKVFKCLKNSNYMGDFVLQTARAEDEEHDRLLIKYKIMTENWIRSSNLH